MPSWMRQYEDLFIETGVLSVEATMGTYGAKAAHKIADRADEEAQVYRAMIVNAQVGLLTALRGRGLLKDVPPCPLRQPPAGAKAARVVTAAILYVPDGRIFLGADHAYAIGAAMEQGVPVLADASAIHGFVDAQGEFLSRADAYERAVQCGQIKDDGGTRLLTSEMLKEGGR